MHEAWLIVARIVWAVMALFDLSLLVIIYPMFVAQLGVVCPIRRKECAPPLSCRPRNWPPPSISICLLRVTFYMPWWLIC